MNFLRYMALGFLVATLWAAYLGAMVLVVLFVVLALMMLFGDWVG